MEEKLLILLKNQALYKGPVTLASGKISNFYIDVRRVSLSSEGIYLISNLVWGLIKNDNISAIGGPTLGADPIVGAVCCLAHLDKKTLEGFLIRKSPKEHGRQQLIEGKELAPGARVVVIDDVATSGGSFVKAIEVLRQAKVEIVKAIAIVDREEGAIENLSKFNCPFVSLFTKSDFFK
ncbi:MAG: orotate phosphoribosyltransferase [Candidatus Omnitrophica bacterium]|nr:orotate phosphoribosyltransferase [Candidatus Omnitrophota bacterium]